MSAAAERKWARTLRTLALLGVAGGVALAGGVVAVAHHDVQTEAAARFGSDHGAVTLRLQEVHPSRRHGLWLVFRLGFERSAETAPGDLGLWYLLPLRTVAFTKDWWSDAFRQ